METVEFWLTRIRDVGQEWRLASRQAVDLLITLLVALTLSTGWLVYQTFRALRWSIGRLQALRNPNLKRDGP